MGVADPPAEGVEPHVDLVELEEPLMPREVDVLRAPQVAAHPAPHAVKEMSPGTVFPPSRAARSKGPSARIARATVFSASRV
jgi:hypothetical protein